VTGDSLRCFGLGGSGTSSMHWRLDVDEEA
jgi:hypothetical protein